LSSVKVKKFCAVTGRQLASDGVAARVVVMAINLDGHLGRHGTRFYRPHANITVRPSCDQGRVNSRITCEPGFSGAIEFSFSLTARRDFVEILERSHRQCGTAQAMRHLIGVPSGGTRAGRLAAALALQTPAGEHIGHGASTAFGQGAPSTKQRRLPTVTCAISRRASTVKNPWWPVTKTLGKLISR